MNDAFDRIEKLLGQSQVTGIDFIYVDEGQRKLDIYFLAVRGGGSGPNAKALLPSLTASDIRIYDPSGNSPDIPVQIQSWINDNQLQVTVGQDGFSLYKLKITDRRPPALPFPVDPFFNDVVFSFKVNCESQLDCEVPEHECPPDDLVDFPVDYQARDFWTFRQALLEFASLRYPRWPDRLEADAGIMLTELMSALGDEMAYYQDRVAREAYFETATQRRSLVRHAQLVDYPVHEGRGAAAWLQVTVSANNDIPAGSNFWATDEKGLRIDFEAGRSLGEVFSNKRFPVRAAVNELNAYRWDEDQVCLPVGSTEMYIAGHHETNLVLEPLPNGTLGKWVLLKTTPLNAAQPARAHMVLLTAVKNSVDPVRAVGDPLREITRISWGDEHKLPFELDMIVLTVHGNMVPVSAGKTHRFHFITGADITELTQGRQELENMPVPLLRAVEREGIDEAITYLCTLPLSEDQNLVWLGNDAATSSPEIDMQQLEFVGNNWQPVVMPWRWQPSLVDVSSSQSLDQHYCLDRGSWRRVVGYYRVNGEIVHNDYASGDGTTIRFGNGEFGLVPAEKSVFRVTYRLGNGQADNVTAGAIKNFDPALGFIQSVTNPLAALNGMDPETATSIKQSAPEDFQATMYRAVRPEDYAEAAERLVWVQKAGAAFRWTGSWLTAFVTPDPLHAVALRDEWRTELIDQLDRFRQAGRETAVMKPRYADLDLTISICVARDVYKGEVAERVMDVLFGNAGYFSSDNFTFGTLLWRSSLEAVIQDVPGVTAVENIRFRRFGWFAWRNFEEPFYDPGTPSIIRVENDQLHPERGIVKLKMHGGA